MSELLHAQLRRVLIDSFGDEELKNFILDNFPDIYNAVEGMNKVPMAREVVVHCLRSNRVPDLIADLKRERPNDSQIAALDLPDSTAENPSVKKAHVTISTEPEAETQEKQIDSFINPVTGKEMVRIPAGVFLYGKEKTPIYLDEYWIDKTPVTNLQYKRFLNANPNLEVPSLEMTSVDGVVSWILGGSKYKWDKKSRTYPSQKADHPVVVVNWHEAKAYAAWADAVLPTEQQWEKAARGTDGRKYPWGDKWQKNCNIREAGVKGTTHVGKYSSYGDSPFGCIDMSGNVEEWTLSHWQEESNQIVVRGGAWNSFFRYQARVVSRSYLDPTNRYHHVGFRVVVRRYPSHLESVAKDLRSLSPRRVSGK